VKKIKPFHSAGHWIARTISPWADVHTIMLVGVAGGVDGVNALDDPDSDDEESDESLLKDL
jgi:hypothetical protein